MEASPRKGGGRRSSRPGAAGIAVVLLAGCALAAGCSTGGGSASMSGAAAPARAGGVSSRGLPVSPGSAAGGELAVLPAPGGQAIVYTASLTVRAADVSGAAAQAARIAAAEGGYVSDESARLDPAHPARSTVSIELKIPASAYQSTLAELSSRLGAQLSLSQHAQDVTQAVADVNSRVASARTAIAQLRRLLVRAGSVSSLLQVQDRINSEEANMEALLSQQRALAHQTSYATVSLLLVSPAAPAPTSSAHGPAGFTGGLAAGWRALGAATSWALTVVGAALPFAIPVALIAAPAFLVVRRRSRGRAGPAAAD